MTQSDRIYRLYIYLMMFWALILPWFFIGIQIVPGFLALVVLYKSIREKQSPIQWHPFFTLIIIYLVIRLVTTLLTPAPLRARSVRSFIDTEWPLFSLLLLTTITIKPEDMKNILRILIFSAGLAGINSIFQFISGIDIFTGNPLGRYGNFYRAAGSYGFFLSFAGNQLMALGMAMAFFFTEKNWRKDKYLYAIATVLIIVSLLTTFARSSWIAFVFMSLLIAIFINRRLFVINLGIILILCAAAFILNPDLQQRFLSIFDAQKNATRLNLIHTSLAMIADNPVTGIGSGMYGDMVPYYKYPGFYDTFCHAHNDHLQIAVISGLPGFFAWIVLWISWFYYTIKVLKKMKKYAVQHRILTGAVLGISGILIAGFFQCYYLDLKNAIFMAFILLVGVNAFKSQAQKNSGTG